MIRTQIQLTESQMQALRKLAISRRVSVARLIRQAIDSMIESSPQDDLEERRKRALAIVGKFGSSKHDISTKHDDYLDFCRSGFQPRLSEESAIWVATGSRSCRGTAKSGSQPRGV